MRTHRPRRPVVESLEGKTLLSAAPLSAELRGPALVAGTHLALQGTIKGTITQDPSNPDAGRQYDLGGKGPVVPLGPTHLGPASQLHSVGFLARGRSEGRLTLIDQGGSVTLKLVGPLQPGFSKLPDHYTFTIVSGTGKYRGATGTGTAGLEVGKFQGAPLHQSASYTLTLHATSTRPGKG